MGAILPNKLRFDSLRGQLEALARDWVERECTSFDAAVSRAAGQPAPEESIWDMPAIDSKRVVGLLVELEPVLGEGSKVPVSVIKPGGYTSSEELIEKLFAEIRERCPHPNKPGVASTATAALPTASQVLR